MKQLLTIFLAIFALYGFCDESDKQTIDTEIKSVTVFLEGAQITRTKTVDIPKGTSTLIFSKLSPFIKASSVQVKTNQKVKILGVNHQHNHEMNTQQSAEAKSIKKRIEELHDKILEKNTLQTIAMEEIDFLKANKVIGGNNQTTSVEQMKNTSEYYIARLKALKFEMLKRDKEIEKLKEKLKNVEKQLVEAYTDRKFPQGEIVIKVQSAQAVSAMFTIEYTVENAGWYPSYDIRSGSIDEPLELVYKANVYQNTQIDWNSINIQLSSSNPTVSAKAPDPRPYKISYYHYKAPSYEPTGKTLTGKVVDIETGNPIPFANVYIESVSIGTTTNFDGEFSMPHPGLNHKIRASFVGYEPKEKTITSDNIIIEMKSSDQTLDEITVCSYDSQFAKEKDIDRMPSRSADAIASTVEGVYKAEDLAKKEYLIENNLEQNQSSLKFEIKKPYTIKSEKKPIVIDLQLHDIATDFEYIAFPRAEQAAYLQASITDYEQYNLLAGTANLFYEGTYIGQTILNPNSTQDTLRISFGTDKNIIVERKLVKSYISRQFIGNKKEKSRHWEISIKNNKNKKINIKLLEQYPVSQNKSIEVELQESSRAKNNTEDGFLEWNFDLSPKAEKSVDVKYSVTYPKYKQLELE